LYPWRAALQGCPLSFQAVTLGTFGNCSVGVGRAPGYTNVDLVHQLTARD